MKGIVLLSVLIVAGCIAEPGPAPPADSVPEIVDTGTQDREEDRQETREEVRDCEDCAALEVDLERVELNVGEAVQVSVRVLNAKGDEVQEPEILWDSQAPEIASVGESGLITGIRNGDTRVAVSSGGFEISIAVFVVGGEPDTMEVSPEGPVSINVDDYVDFTAQVTEGSPVCAFVYSMGDATVASVSLPGRVTGESIGSTILTVQCGVLTAEVEIGVTGLEPGLMDGERLLAWFRSTDGVTTSGTKVSEWRGISDHAWVLEDNIQDPPQLMPVRIAGYPAVRFKEGQTLATVGNFNSRAEIIVGHFTLFFVSKSDRNSPEGALIATCTQAGGEQQIGYEDSDELYILNEFAGVDLSITTDFPTTEFQVLTFKRTSSEIEIFQNGQLTASRALSDSGNFHFSQIGASCDDDFLEGEIAEILIFGEALDSADQAGIEAYLQARYNL